MLIATPKEFSFDLCLQFLQRSPRELLHHVTPGVVAKAIRTTSGVVVFTVSGASEGLHITFLTSQPDDQTRAEVIQFVREWFDLETDLRPFYRMAETDKLLKDPVARYFGYRIVGQPDLFESLVWAVLGQQINLAFAYTLKQRFVERFGERIVIGSQEYFLFPTPETVSMIRPDELMPLQFSTQKSRYTITIAEAFASGVLSKEKIMGLPLTEAKDELMKIKGVGNWTANYALMKTFRHPDAFPTEDAGLHNAIKNIKKMKAKPTVEQVRRIFKKYKGWEAYATLYLWKTLERVTNDSNVE